MYIVLKRYCPMLEKISLHVNISFSVAKSIIIYHVDEVMQDGADTCKQN